ncbi:MAG: translation initiation factor IF-3 [Bacillota bacterium]
MEDINIFKELLTDYDIREREVRLVNDDGEQLGIMPTVDAMAIAEQRNLNLVMIAPQSKPVVCKLMDYKKYRFDFIKKEKEDRKNNKGTEIKEIKLSPTIDVGDVEIKAKQARKFMVTGYKVNVSIRMKGRQQAHPELAVEVMNRFFEKIKDVAQMDKKPTQEGRNITMALSPLQKK